MTQIGLLPFQVTAADTIAARFDRLVIDEERPYITKKWAVPFYQALAALTGSGKTPILADAVAQIRAQLPVEPIVLWISKAKAVVDQTLANFQAGGKYAHLIEGFLPLPIAELTGEIIRDATTPVMVLATVGTFNQNKKEEGSLKIHKGLWSKLTTRVANDVIRPLVIVYDEGHNLSDQQTSLLLELHPDAILVASATMKTPERLARVIQHLKDHGWSKDDLVTTVKSKDVVLAHLVKEQIRLGGYATLMESAIDNMLDAFTAVSKKATRLRAGFSPKAIYVCQTNISQDDGSKDNPARPFDQRKAPPILIWRHLVRRGVNPAEIATYTSELRFDRKGNPPPSDFVLFSGGEEDFGAFCAGNYRHIIFNKSLQEGWDDPECCFAYIDKSMGGSSIHAEQVIGRVLRQPGAKHYNDPELNTANFFIRLDDKQSFHKILETVRVKITAELPEVKLDGYIGKSGRERSQHEPKKEVLLPHIHINADEAMGKRGDGPFMQVLKGISDYRGNQTATVGAGHRIVAVQAIGANEKGTVKTRKLAHSNRVLARWIVRREMQSLYTIPDFPGPADAVDWANPIFDAKVEITSPAAQSLRDSAAKLVEAYLTYGELAFEKGNTYPIGPVFVDRQKNYIEYNNALHAGYSGLNEELEKPVARAIDETGLTWVRNPSNAGYSIPLLQTATPRRFFPDFLVFKGKVVFALDTKGAHLMAKDAGMKLFDIRDEKNAMLVLVRFITVGRWSDCTHQLSKDGYSVWSLRNGKPHSRHFPTVEKVVEAALKT